MRLKYLILLFVGGCLFSPLISQAATTGSLIKSATDSSVYYLGQDQKRYAFPNEAVYKSWYSDFSGVQTVSASELASYQLAANITYRPGTRLIKITTDPKVYAVAHGGVLRWVQTEAVANQLFGASWARQVDDLPDTFFINYNVGTPIASVSDYSPSGEQAAATSIAANWVTAPSTTPVTPPVTAPTSTNPAPVSTSTNPFTITLQTSTPTPHYGETFTLRTEASPASSVLRTKIYLDATEQRTCEYYICSSDIYIPLTDTQSTHQVRVEVYGPNGAMSSSTLRVAANSNSSPYINLILVHPDVEPTRNREIIAQAINSFIARTIDIYVDGNIAHSCGNQQECRYVEQEASPIGTVHTTFVVATDTNGATTRSDSKTFSVVANDHPVVTVTPDKTALYTGERMNVTVMGSDDDGIQQTMIRLDGAVIQTCALSTCTVAIGPWTQARTFQVTGSATDLMGARTDATSTLITVQAR